MRPACSQSCRTVPRLCCRTGGCESGKPSARVHYGPPRAKKILLRQRCFETNVAHVRPFRRFRCRTNFPRTPIKSGTVAQSHPESIHRPRLDANTLTHEAKTPSIQRSNAFHEEMALRPRKSFPAKLVDSPHMQEKIAASVL